MSPAKCSTLIAAAILLILPGTQPGTAGVAALDPECGEACRSTLEELLAAEQSSWFPVLATEAERFETGTAQGRCEQERTAEPVVHAIVLAPFYDNFVKLPGTQNDAALWRELFRKRGVTPANLHVLDGNGVTREAILDVMRAVMPCVRERDQVVLTFSGGATSYKRWGAQDAGTFLSSRCGDASLMKDPRYKRICGKIERSVALAFDELVGRFNEHVLFSSDVVIAGHVGVRTQLSDGSAVTGLRASEISNFAIQVQNRGADVIFILDTNFAEDFRLLDQQESARFDAAWRWERGGTDQSGQAGPVELFGTGEMAALYAARAEEVAYETKKTGGVVLGELTFAISEALRSNPSPTIEQLAREVDRTMEAESSRQVPVFEATNAGLRFLATRSEPEAHPERIEMINPLVTRGAIPIKEPELEIVARYDGPQPAPFASIDGLTVKIDPSGQFRRSVKLGTRTEVPIRVYGRDAGLLAERRLLFGQDEVKASLAPVGRRLALLIANQNYSDPAFPTLATPIADAKAVQQVLSGKYGFSTRLALASGAERDLLLIDATKTEIRRVLHDLRKSLTAEDQLVIFYAGHGQVDQDNNAYWVPVDGIGSEDFTWMHSFEITEDIRRLPSSAVLLISDSCYAGGISRDSVATPEGPRDRYLAKSTRYKARQLIASGGDEPVADGGGGGHSLFARALIEALDEMPETVFTANELFSNKVKPKAIEYAFSSSAKGQTPVFYRVTHAGDEPESEFVFTRAE